MFKPIPLPDFLDKEAIAAIQNYYTEFEKIPVADLYISEPSMQGVQDIQESARKFKSHNVVLQEMILPKNRKLAWSNEFLNTCPASVLVALSTKCHEVFAELFRNYYKEKEEGSDGEKKK